MGMIRQWLWGAGVWITLTSIVLANNGKMVFLDPAAEPKPGYPASYRVQAGDTLWTVAELFLSKPWLAGDLLSPKAPQVFPGDQVSLFTDNDRLMLQFKQGRQVKLSPGMRYPRLERAIKVIPLDSIRQFLTRPQVVSEEEIEQAPYIVATADARLLATTGDILYARELDELTDLDTYMIVRLGQPYTDPISKEVLIYESVYLGEAKMKKEGDPSVLEVITSDQGIRPGDRLMQAPKQQFERDLYPHIPFELEQAFIIAVVDGLSQIGQFQVVVINKGENDDLERGHILKVFRGGQWITDDIRKKKEKIFLPSLETATLLIFHVFNRVSYALVMKASDVVHVGDEVNIPR